MKLLNNSSSHGWCRRFFKWVGEREREIWTERERERDMGRERERERYGQRERERDSLLMVWAGERERFFIDGMSGMGAEMVK